MLAFRPLLARPLENLLRLQHIRAGCLALALALGSQSCGGNTQEGPRWISLAQSVQTQDGESTSEGARRVQVGSLSAEGIEVRPGTPAQLRITLPEDSALRFGLAAELSEPGKSATFVITIDGLESFRHTLDGPAPVVFTNHEITLSNSGDASVEFSVEGNAARSAFIAPVIGPKEVGRYGERPWEVRRPDLVLFIADTMRADVLQCYGAPESVAPNLDRLASESMRFLNARSTSNWTLPAHASMFTGTLSPQNGVHTSRTALSPELTTIAEHLAEHGYRTAAITDGVFVSQRFGMDEGFQTFLEHEEWDLSETLTRARQVLDHDDGRPLFLVVHTYRMHGPYRVGPHEDEERWDALKDIVDEELKDASPARVLALIEEGLDDLRELYLEGARALDAQWQPWFEHVAERGLFEEGYLMFTSDHGEAFFEHGHRGHSKGLYDEEVRVPLFIYGKSLEARDIHAGASLNDVPRTLAELARVPPAFDWGGRSLLGPESDSLELVFGKVPGGHQRIARIQGERKIVIASSPKGLPSGQVLEAFDLSSDPGEKHNLVDRESWPKEMRSQLEAEVERLGGTPVKARSIDASAEIRSRLAELGYADN